MNDHFSVMAGLPRAPNFAPRGDWPRGRRPDI